MEPNDKPDDEQNDKPTDEQDRDELDEERFPQLSDVLRDVATAVRHVSDVVAYMKYAEKYDFIVGHPDAEEFLLYAPRVSTAMEDLAARLDRMVEEEE